MPEIAMEQELVIGFEVYCGKCRTCLNHQTRVINSTVYVDLCEKCVTDIENKLIEKYKRQMEGERHV